MVLALVQPRPDVPDPLERALAGALATLDDAPAALAPVTAAARSVCERGGKRIRPRLCLLAYEAVARTPATTAGSAPSSTSASSIAATRTSASW